MVGVSGHGGPPIPRVSRLAQVQAGYAQAAVAWAGGAESVYLPMAAALLDLAPRPLAGRTVLDVGAGTGVISRLARAAGARVVAIDASQPMLAYDAPARPPAVAADVMRLPLRDGAAGGAAAAFVLNHLTHPVAALAEMVRAVGRGGFVLASVFSAAERPPAKEAIDAVLAGAGWEPPEWYQYLKTIDSQLGSMDTMGAAARQAGLDEVAVTDRPVETGLTDPSDIVNFRFSQPHVTDFLAGLAPDVRQRVTGECVAAVAATGTRLAPRVVMLAATRTT